MQRLTTKPFILFCCNHLWSLFRKDQHHIMLPPGLHLLPTRLRHPLAEQMQEPRQTTQIIDDSEEFHRWDRMWYLEAQVDTVTINHADDEIEEWELWDKYWSLERDGKEESANSERVQLLIDQGVSESFVKIVEKRKDGYYVLLPWKHDTIQVPGDRAIAFRRLISVWSSLQREAQLLEQ